MNLNDLTTNQQDIDKSKEDLVSFCSKYAITKFEAEDIVELLEDGENITWIVDQLKEENAEINVDVLSSLLDNIKAIVGPAEEEEPEDLDEEKFEKDVPEVGEETIEGMPDLSQLDLSQLPEGMKLPPGVGMEQIQKMMESPQGEFLTDFSVYCQEKGVAPEALPDAESMKELNKEWMSTPREAFDGKTPSEMLAANPSLMPQKVETYHREEPRVGRNDPCPCGSGKKYKKCCGRGK